MMSEYLSLRSLKNMPENILADFKNLESRKTDESKDVLIICKSKDECRKALRRMADNVLGECKVHLSSLKLEMSDRSIYFAPVKDISFHISGLRYKEYYFEEDI